MSLFKQQKTRQFNLKSRFNDTNSSKEGRKFSGKWKETRGAYTKRKKSVSLGILFVLLVLLIYAMYFIDKKYL